MVVVDGTLNVVLKRASFAHVTHADCDAVAAKLGARPRKRLGYKTPEECYIQAS